MNKTQLLAREFYAWANPRLQKIGVIRGRPTSLCDFDDATERVHLTCELVAKWYMSKTRQNNIVAKPTTKRSK